MTEPPEQQNRDLYAGAEPVRQSGTGMPRWVKVFGIAEGSRRSGQPISRPRRPPRSR